MRQCSDVIASCSCEQLLFLLSQENKGQEDVMYFCKSHAWSTEPPAADCASKSHARVVSHAKPCAPAATPLSLV
jgi:hypothetical protein